MNLFFICNQPNYARWASKYYDNLMKIAETHPDSQYKKIISSNYKHSLIAFINLSIHLILKLPKDLLINISSGKAASKTVEKFLLNIEEHGEIKRKTFIAECEQDDSRFEKSIKKNTDRQLFHRLCKKKNNNNWWKTVEVRVQKDLFGRILGISIDHKVDMAKIFTYPITPVPLSLCHFDGGICKTHKSILMKCLEKDVEHNPPSHIDLAVIDGFFLLHTMKNVPKTFGNISKKNVTYGHPIKCKNI
ncbi:hypothetical protein TNCV_4654401 [Trichonephila clavipes]|nr:hypothetical protein TNCV_4654401 [Trichonephila clavipes]